MLSYKKVYKFRKSYGICCMRKKLASCRDKSARNNICSFLNSSFFQTIAVIIVGFLAYNIGLEQNNINKQLAMLNNSPKYNQPIRFSTFESDIKMENVGRVSLHNIQSEFIDLYINPNTTLVFGGLENMLYDMEPGQMTVLSIPNKLKVKGKTIIAKVCYVFNNDPFQKIDSNVNSFKLKEDPFYEVSRRSQAYREYQCSSLFIKYNIEGLPQII